jgi:hypothetical protein
VAYLRYYPDIACGADEKHEKSVKIAGPRFELITF